MMLEGISKRMYGTKKMVSAMLYWVEPGAMLKSSRRPKMIAFAMLVLPNNFPSAVLFSTPLVTSSSNLTGPRMRRGTKRSNTVAVANRSWSSSAAQWYGRVRLLARRHIRGIERGPGRRDCQPHCHAHWPNQSQMWSAISHLSHSLSDESNCQECLQHTILRQAHYIADSQENVMDLVLMSSSAIRLQILHQSVRSDIAKEAEHN